MKYRSRPLKRRHWEGCSNSRAVPQLLKDGLRVSYRKQQGENEEEGFDAVHVIDWNEPGNNDFFLASQFWISGDYGNKRADLIGFVNGIPLVFIELKASHGGCILPTTRI